MEPVREGRRICIDVHALLGNWCQAFVNVNVKTTEECVTTVEASVYWYVVTLNICIPTVNIMIHRFDVPHHDRPGLRVAQGDKDYNFTTTVSGFCLCFCHSCG
jgi:hypothetical protein